ncbi:MAG: hypothetical protein Q8T13_20090 [Acidobacteriota bacterium]|nr:hypothetical protein [Acidobacteriota bacterium]
MSTGFILKRLLLSGPRVEGAEVTFERGLNVIAGPSDTGKTFIVECIDYALGSGTAPRDIKKAEPYTSIFLDIEGPDGTLYTLERGLRGGDIGIKAMGHHPRTVSAKHDPNDPDTVSAFLLTLCGLEGRKVRMNSRGTTRMLSFRDIAPLVIVDELSVVTKGSPALSGQFIHETVESSVFRLLLTGTDDSGVIAKVDPKVLKGRTEGKTEVLAALLDRAREKLQERKLEVTLEDKREQLARADESIDAANNELEAEQAGVAAIEERRRKAWNELRQIESRSNVLTELQARFELLEQQYGSDLRRLEAVAEAGFRLGQMKQDRCPVCGALPEHHVQEHQHNDTAAVDVAGASRAEAQKTAALMRDLATTLASNGAEIEQLAASGRKWKLELDAAALELRTQFQPRLQAAVQKFRQLQLQRDKIYTELELLGRVDEYERLLGEAEAPRAKQKKEPAQIAVSSGAAENFSRETERLLRDWRFPNLDRVTFSEEKLDVVISGEPRGSHGKGVRAITHAAFNLALLRLFQGEGKPYSAMVLIDSPLVVYREPDPGEEEFPASVKDSFYREVSKVFTEMQVIILENDEPPADLGDAAHVVLFTGTAEGRWGFIPLPPAQPVSAPS